MEVQRIIQGFSGSNSGKLLGLRRLRRLVRFFTPGSAEGQLQRFR